MATPWRKAADRAKERACLPSPRALKNERGILRRLLPVAITICLGVGVSVAAFVTVQTWEHTQVRATFESAAHDQATVLGHIIQRDLLMLKLLERFYAGSEKVERDEFHEFTKSIPEDIQCVQALEWVPRVRDAERAAYEEEGCREGLTGFQITERDADGRMVRAGPREEYFPVHFAEPLTGNEQALGFDLGSEPTRRAALEAARDSGEMRGTGRIRLVQETGDQWGILVLVPVYRNGASPETVECVGRTSRGLSWACSAWATSWTTPSPSWARAGLTWRCTTRRRRQAGACWHGGDRGCGTSRRRRRLMRTCRP